ncbi:MAG: ABC transporter ATP-binding protein [Acidimicrobiia bacterium]
MADRDMSRSGLRATMRIRRGDSFQLDVAFDVAAGSTMALVGPNGAGKSTVVAGLAGLVPLDGGQIVLDDRSLDDPVRDVFVPPEQRRVGVVFQDYLLFPHLSVVGNVSFGLRGRGVGRREAKARALEWIGRLGLGGLADKRPSELSGGQSQRVALARALVTDPDMLLLDEPLAALDVTTRAQLRRELKKHLDSFAGPRVLITHDPTEAVLLAERVCVIEHGAISQIGSPDEMRLRPRTPYIADLAGANLISGWAKDGVIDTGGQPIHVAIGDLEGPVLASFRPSSISVHVDRPQGSARNVWRTRVDLIEHLGDRARLRTGAPLPLTVEITDGSVRDLGLEPGASIWVSLKATEIAVEPDPQSTEPAADRSALRP